MKRIKKAVRFVWLFIFGIIFILFMHLKGARVDFS